MRMTSSASANGSASRAKRQARSACSFCAQHGTDLHDVEPRSVPTPLDRRHADVALGCRDDAPEALECGRGIRSHGLSGECLVARVECQHGVTQDAQRDHEHQRALLVGGVEHALGHEDIVRAGSDEPMVCEKALQTPAGDAPRPCSGIGWRAAAGALSVEF